LRIRLADFTPTKSQRQVLRRNADLKHLIRPIVLTPEKEALFLKHTARFRERRPESLAAFLGPQANRHPVKGYELSVFDPDDRLLACSYFHLGEKAVSGTYCFFDPEEGKRSLGTYTMLQELFLARDMGLHFYYHGYCYDVPSQFDYKLNFNNLEVMDWKTGHWEPRERMPVRQWEKLVNEP
jgi:arginine-tRNA-protein transferase